MMWSKCVSELLALHAMFRKLGYPSAELFVSPHINGHVQFMLMRNEKTFVVDVMRVPDTKALIEEWGRAANWWNDNATKEEERESIYQSSIALKNGKALVESLALRGLYPLKDANGSGHHPN